MQTNLFCFQIKTGGSTFAPPGDKCTAKNAGPAQSRTDPSFPLALQQIAEETESESPAGIAKRLLESAHVIELGQTGETTTDPLEAAAGPLSGITESEKTGENETAVLAAAAPTGEPESLRFEGDPLPRPANTPPADWVQKAAAPANSELPQPLPAGSETTKTDAGFIAPPGDLLPGGSAAVRSQAGFTAVDAAAGGETALDFTSKSTGPVSNEVAADQQHRPKQTEAVALFQDQGQQGSHPGPGAADPSPPQPERTEYGRYNILGQAKPVSAPGDQPASVDGSPPSADEPRDAKDHMKLGGHVDASSSSGDRSASETPESSPGRVAPDQGSRPSTAAAGDGRLSVSTAESPMPAADPQKMEKPIPAAIIDQIVKKAVIRFRNHHSEVRIDLKPELLGHLRLHIGTEHQQVTLRILTEHPAVKEIIESSAAQLKADLLNQGLQMDQLEVGVNGERDRLDRRPDYDQRPAGGMRGDDRSGMSAGGQIDEIAASAASVTSDGRSIDTFV